MKSPKDLQHASSDPVDKAFGCFFLFAAGLAVLIVVVILILIGVGIDLAYENWG